MTRKPLSGPSRFLPVDRRRRRRRRRQIFEQHDYADVLRAHTVRPCERRHASADGALSRAFRPPPPPASPP